MRCLFKRPVGVVSLAAAFLLISACATTGDSKTVDYATDAQDNLKRGIEALEDKNYEEAEKFFDYVHSKYPFLEAAKEAELKLADTDYARELYESARDRYQTFVKLHPTHSKVDYAAFRAAKTHREEIPADFFFLPPAIEKDQAETLATLRAMGDFLRVYPNSSHAPEGKKIYEDVRKRLAQHELYVAAFYRKRDRWTAVAWRLENVVEKYSGAGYDEEALFGLHEAYLKLKAPDKAQGALRRVIERMPGTPAAERAQRILGS
jgi:outer membrane protein assembly factor BamD